MKKNFLFKGVAMLGTISLLANTVLPGLAYADVMVECDGSEVAKIGNVCYASLSDAIEDAADGATIDLLKNVTVEKNSMLKINNDNSLIINGNGKTINGSSDENTTNHTILIGGNGNVTLKDLTISGFGNSQDPVYGFALSPLYTSATYGGKLTLSGVMIENFNRQAIVIGNGDFEINNCTFRGDGVDDHYQQGILIYNGSGTIKNTNISGIRASSNSDTYGILLAGDGIVDISDTDILDSDAAIAVSTSDGDWANYLADSEKEKSNGKIILGEGNNFEGTANVIAIVPMGTDGNKTDSKIEVIAGTYSGAILIDGNIEGDASIEIYGGTFSADPSEYLTGDFCTAKIDNEYPVKDCRTITLNPATNGTFESDITSPTIEGVEVTLTVDPEDYYELSGVVVNEGSVAVTEDEGNYKFTVPADNVTVTVEFKAIEYSITYVGAETGNNATGYTYESDSFALNNPSKDGYDFLGWTGTALDDLTTEVTIPAHSTGDRIYVANWSAPIEYTISYELNGGALPEGVENTGTYTIETETFTVVNPNKRDDYKFIGWTGTDLDSPVTKLTIANGSTGTRSYEVVWEAIGGESSTPGSVDEKVVPDAGAEVSTGGANISLDNSIVVEGDADTGTLAAATTVPQIVIQQKEADAAYQAEGTNESKLESDFQGFVETTGMIADVNGILDVQLIYLDGSGNAEELGKVNFSEPVKVYIPVNGASSVRIRVKHTGESTYGTGGLTTNANAKCKADGTVQSPDEYTGGEIPVNNGKALIYTCSASSFVAYSEVKPTPAPSYSGGGGGGGSSKKTETNTGSVTTGAVENATGSTETLGEENKDETTNENNEGNTAMTEDAAVAKFGQEQIDAYKWALENGITTMKTVEEARLDKPLTRAELAKMMVVYVAKVLEKQPVVTGDVSYQDVDANKLGDLAGYIKLAYQYQIMGINADGTPIEFFNPNGLVTRGEYATVFSRVLFGSKFNKEGADFYTNHLEALKAAGILSNTEPTIKEMRGWVMLMMYRSSKNIEAIEKVAAEVEATDEEVAEAEAKAEEETTTEENTENAEATTGDVAEAPEAEATTGDVVEAPEAEATTGDVAETPAEASTGDTVSD